MSQSTRWPWIFAMACCAWAGEDSRPAAYQIGREVSIARHLADGDECRLSPAELVRFGRLLFTANWTAQEGAGRPLMKGNFRPLSDRNSPLTGVRAFNRVSGPDANSCYGCHNMPYGIAGGSGDFVTSVFVLGQRFDFATFDPADKTPTRGSTDEHGRPVTLQTMANLRATTDMFGSGYVEMLARQMTADLQKIRDSIPPGGSRELFTKGVSFGTLARRADGTWDAGKVTGLGRESLVSPAPINPPPLVLRPWHQSGSVVSLREFTNNAYHQHHGLQSTERFGLNTDQDGDGVVNELTRADITAVTMFQAALQVPGRVIPRIPEVEQAVLEGERQFQRTGCAACHIPSLPLDRQGWIYSEPNPYNPPFNLRTGEARSVAIDLTSDELPPPRLHVEPTERKVVQVPAYTDLKMHDITDPQDPAEAEALDQNQTTWTDKLFLGNRRFLTRRLWGTANQPGYFHHGAFTTLRQAVLAHHGEALESRRAFEALSAYRRDCVIEFLKTLQVLPPGTTELVVDQDFKPREWPPGPGVR